jgi:hypothetical protein
MPSVSDMYDQETGQWQLLDKIMETIESYRGDQSDGEVMAALVMAAAKIIVQIDQEGGGDTEAINTTKRLLESSIRFLRYTQQTAH